MNSNIIFSLKRTDSGDSDYKKLVAFLDADLRIRDGADHAFYAQYNKSDDIKHVVVFYENEEAAGCGAFKLFSPGIVEIKRMYVRPESRKKGIASKILTELEQWAASYAYTECILETGKKQPEAIALYVKSGYHQIPNYGQYANVENSVCMRKVLDKNPG